MNILKTVLFALLLPLCFTHEAAASLLDYLTIIGAGVGGSVATSAVLEINNINIDKKSIELLAKAQKMLSPEEFASLKACGASHHATLSKKILELFGPLEILSLKHLIQSNEPSKTLTPQRKWAKIRLRCGLALFGICGILMTKNWILPMLHMMKEDKLFRHFGYAMAGMSFGGTLALWCDIIETIRFSKGNIASLQQAQQKLSPQELDAFRTSYQAHQNTILNKLCEKLNPLEIYVLTEAIKNNESPKTLASKAWWLKAGGWSGGALCGICGILTIKYIIALEQDDAEQSIWLAVMQEAISS